jgi:hypothetical protein
MKKEKESFDDMLSRATWWVIQGIVKGEGIRSVVFGVYSIMLGWQKEHGIVVEPGKRRKK